MQIQEEIVKHLAEYFFEILPKEGWSTFYYNIGIDRPQPQIISFGKIIGQGLSSYYCEPKENFPSFSNELRDSFLNSDNDEIIYSKNAPIDSEGNEIWNTFRFKLNKDRTYEGRFFWDDTRFLKNIERQVKGMPDYIIQTTQYDIWEFNDWITADVVLIVDNDKIDSTINYYYNEVLINTLSLPLDTNTYNYILFAYETTNNGLLRDKLDHWNTLTIKVFHDNYCFKNEYAKYEVTLRS